MESIPKDKQTMKVTVYMGDKKLKKEEYKNYICTSEYVINLVDEVYYSKIEAYRKRIKEKEGKNQ